MINIIKILALKNNYIWIIYNHINECIIIDPGESIKTLKMLKKLKFIPKAILLTHNHADHTDGIYDLIEYFPKIVVYSPNNIKKCKNCITVSKKNNLFLLNKNIKIINLTGHTSNHIGFYFDFYLFSGDTIFSAGCGITQSGLEQEMYKSLLKIQNLPNNTLIYSGHEYTLSNLNFAHSIFPTNQFISNYRNKISKLYKIGKFISPTTLELELKINPFFLINNAKTEQALSFLTKEKEKWKIFKALRYKKNLFKET